MSRWAATAATAVALAGAASTGAAGARHGTAATPLLSELRVCSGTAFDADARACARDERERALVARELYCSVRVRDAAGRRIRMQLLASGEEVVGSSPTIPEGARTVYIRAFRRAGTPFGDLPLIGGPWTCLVALGGERLRAEFRSGGPRNLVVSLSRCTPAGTVRVRGTVVCAEDRGPGPFASGTVVCSALVAAAKGRIVTGELLAGGRRVARAQVRARSVATPVGVTYSGLGKGSYACRFVIGGVVRASARFSIV